jgi:hypothetical protein
MAKKKESTSLEFETLPGTVGTAVLGELIGTTQRYVQMLEHEGIIERLPSGEFETKLTLQKLFKYYRESKAKKSDLQAVKAEILKRKLAQIDGTLIPREQQDSWQRVVVAMLANTLEEAPARYAKEFPELSLVYAQERLIKIFGDEGIKGKLYTTFKKIAENPNIESAEEAGDIEVDGI